MYIMVCYDSLNDNKFVAKSLKPPRPVVTQASIDCIVCGIVGKLQHSPSGRIPLVATSL